MDYKYTYKLYKNILCKSATTDTFRWTGNLRLCMSDNFKTDKINVGVFSKLFKRMK